MPGTTVDIKEAGIHLSRLIERAERGEEIIIAKAGIPKVRLTPVTGERIVRCPGRFAGSINVTADFFRPLAEEDLAAWEGSSEPLK